MHLTQTIYLTKSKYKDFNSQLDQLTLISKNLKNQANFLLKQASSYHYYQKEIIRLQNLIQNLDLSKNKINNGLNTDLDKTDIATKENLDKNKKDNLKKKLEKQLNFSETIFKSLHIDQLVHECLNPQKIKIMDLINNNLNLVLYSNIKQSEIQSSNSGSGNDSFNHISALSSSSVAEEKCGFQPSLWLVDTFCK